LARFAQPLVATLKRVFTAQSTALRTKRVVLVSAVIVFLFVLLQLSAYRPSLRSERSWVDSLLGVAQAPVRTPAVSGNPDVRVWVDVNTALYYCPGSRLYGKTPGGHFARQRVARQNQFGPASRTPCW
jgi:hypothetical protein